MQEETEKDAEYMAHDCFVLVRGSEQHFISSLVYSKTSQCKSRVILKFVNIGFTQVQGNNACYKTDHAQSQLATDLYSVCRNEYLIGLFLTLMGLMLN